LKDAGIDAEQVMAAFGKRNGVVAAAILESTDNIADLTKELKDAGGTAKEVADNQLDTLQGAMKLLQSAIEDVKLSIFNGLKPVLRDLIDDLTETVQKVGNWVKEHPKLTGMIVKFTAAMGALFLVFGPFLIMLPGLVQLFALLKMAYVGVIGQTIAATFATKSLTFALAGTAGLAAALFFTGNMLFRAAKAYLEMKDAMHEEEKAQERATDAARQGREELEKLGIVIDDNTWKMLNGAEKAELTAKLLAEFNRRRRADMEVTGIAAQNMYDSITNAAAQSAERQAGIWNTLFGFLQGMAKRIADMFGAQFIADMTGIDPFSGNAMTSPATTASSMAQAAGVSGNGGGIGGGGSIALGGAGSVFFNAPLIQADMISATNDEEINRLAQLLGDTITSTLLDQGLPA
jgi:phage-related tail protein